MSSSLKLFVLRQSNLFIKDRKIIGVYIFILKLNCDICRKSLENDTN